MQKVEPGMESEDGEVVLVGRAEIDTRAPFRSVKEAIVLFGERVLAGEVYANKLNEMRVAASNSEHGQLPTMGSVFVELEETKQSLEKAKEDNLVMANSLCSLQEELQKTRGELQQLKARESEKKAPVVETEMEDLKFVEAEAEAEAAAGDRRPELQKRRYVKFANPPSVAQVIIAPEAPLVLERQFSVDSVMAAPTAAAAKKKKKQPLMPLLAGIFSKKKGHQEVASPKSRRQ